MAETEPNLVENNEAQIFSIQETDQHNIVGEFDQQNFGVVPEVYQFAGNESENQILAISGQEFSGNESENQILAISGQEFSGKESENQSLAVNEQNFGGNELENNIGVISEQTYAENVDEHAVDEDQTIHELDENQLNQEFVDNEASELGNAQIDSDFDKKEKHENNLAGEGEEKKWPGWPGESVFRMLVPGQKVGNVIGRKGEYIKKIVEETRARIKVLDGPPGSQERAVMVSAKEEPESSLPPAMDGLLRVHRRIVDGLDGDSTEVPPAGGKVSTRLLVPATQAGSLIGKQGASVKCIQEAANCVVRVLGEADLPAFALQDDRVVEVVGEAVNVHKAIELIASQLRKFLVDRGIISVFEKQMQALNNPREHFPPQPWGPHHGLPPNGGGGYGSNMQYMPPPRQLDSYYPPGNMAPPDRQPHQGISSFGREPSANPQAAPSMITQITQHIQVPLIYADSVIGSSGSTISYIRRTSGATVTVQETRGVPGEMTVEINGTASQVQAAQQLVQNFLAEAAAASAAPTQTGGATDQGYSQGYNSYATPASAPAYGSAYGGSYGY